MTASSISLSDQPNHCATISEAVPAVQAAPLYLERLITLVTSVSGCGQVVLTLTGGAVPGLETSRTTTGLTAPEVEAVCVYCATLPVLPGITTWSALSRETLTGAGSGLEASSGVEAGAEAGAGLLPDDFPPCGFLAHVTLMSSDRLPSGSLCLIDPVARDELTPSQQSGLLAIADLIMADQERELRQARLLRVTSRSMRADRMLRMVAEAVSCADALSGLLEELCRFHGATLGRIWHLDQGNDTISEVSRFDDESVHGPSYFRHAPETPISSHNMIVAEAIRANLPRCVIYSEVADPSRFALLAGAITAGLISQVSYPIPVQDQRFGVSLAFSRPEVDLQAVAADMGALANTIRPALFRKITEERTRFVAHHDDLTQLSNRVVFQDRLIEALGEAARHKTGVALLYLDLDGFKLVNDTHGHQVGDQLLAAVAGRLRDSVRVSDTVARVGGDEFAIIQVLEGSPSAATKLARRLVDTIATPFELAGRRVVIGVSIGVALHPGHGDTPDRLLRNADTALYRAKESGRNTFRVFDPAMNIRHQERLLIERDLGDAITERQFNLAFQPICRADTLEIFGFEALLRWHHPERGPIDPSEFVRLAETSGLILPLGQWALEAACVEAARWPARVRLSVNLSPLQFRQPSLPRIVAETLARAGLPGCRLDLEVTEGLLLEDSSVVMNTMYALKDQGIRISLDDFGTAYASLSYLRSFPFARKLRPFERHHPSVALPEHEPLACQPDRRSHQPLTRQRAVAHPRGFEAEHRARHADGEPAIGRALRHRRPVPILEHRRGRGERRFFAEVEEGRAAVGEMERHEPTSADIAGLRINDRQRIADRYRRIDRIAALPQDLDADVSGDRVCADHHAA